MSAIDPTHFESYYLLGRAYTFLFILGDRSERGIAMSACNSYRKACYINESSDTLWMSVAVLYFYMAQWRNSLHAFLLSVRLNPSVPLIWRNLGVLVSITVLTLIFLLTLLLV